MIVPQEVAMKKLIFSDNWHRDSVVRMSVFGWWTFHDLCLIYGWQVTTLHVNCSLMVSQKSQGSLPTLLSQRMNSNPCNQMDYGAGNHQMADQGFIWLFSCRSKSVDSGLAYRLYAHCLWHKNAIAAAVCGLWHYISIMYLSLSIQSPD